MRPADVVTLLQEAWPSHMRQRESTLVLDKWYRGEQQEIGENGVDGMPFMPDGRASTKEYADIASRAPSNWAGFLVRSMSQMCRLEGVYLPGSSTTLDAWRSWQENRWDSRQAAVYRGALAHGLSYTTVLPGKSLFSPGKTVAKWEGHSAIKMSAYFAEVEDEFPMYAVAAEPVVTPDAEKFWSVKLYDEQATHYLEVKGMGLDKKDFTYISYEEHGLGFTPVIQFASETDLDGRAMGEIEPFIPLLRRIDQDVFDRLVVQRFGAWVVRYGTGLVKPETDEDAKAQAILLKVGEMLMAEEATAKFGTLEATDLKGFIDAHDADLRILSAVSQRPPHHLLGASSNLQAEALASTEQGLNRRGDDFRTGCGEQIELKMRVSAIINGNAAEAGAADMQVRWKDYEARSLSQTADALGKLATQLEVPVELLWERIPNWTDSDTERAKPLRALAQVAALLEEVNKTTEAEPPPAEAA